MTPDEVTRRAAVRRGVAFGGAVLAAVTIPSLVKVRDALAQADGDAQILEVAIGIEQTAVAVYDAAVGSGLLDEATMEIAELFRDQEQEHADALIAALEDLGGTPPEPPGAGEVDRLGHLRSQEELARFALELETIAVAAYYDAHAQLEDEALLRTVASIMANDAQHLVVLRQILGEDPSPAAFVTGEA